MTYIVTYLVSYRGSPTLNTTKKIFENVESSLLPKNCVVVVHFPIGFGMGIMERN